MNTSLLNKEIQLIQPLLSSLIVSAVSGLIIYLNTTLSWWVQFNVLGHVLFGTLLSLLCVPYLYQHFKRTLGIRRPLMIVSGISSALLFIGFIYTGLHLAIVGHIETQKIQLLLHRYGSIVLITVIALHFIFHRWIKTRKDNKEFHSLKHHSSLKYITTLGIYLVFITTASFSYSYFYPDPAISKLTQNYQYDYGKHPFRPSQSETPDSKFIAESQIAGSDDCAHCHAAIAQQWSSSVHRHAASDPTYVTNINLLEKNKGISATRYCEGCHSPVALLTGQLTPGGKHGGVSGTTANEEGISCLSCHRITHAVHLDGVASYHYAPAQEYLFQHSESAVFKKINRYLINIYSDQHKEDMAQPVLQQATLCATCHAQFMDKDLNNWGWVKLQDDYSAWLNSPYSQKHQQGFSSSELVRCQDCHMPLVTASDPSANEQGKVRSHRFAAANTMLPTLNKDSKQLSKTISFLQSNKMHISIERPNRDHATQSTLNLQESLRLHKETPFYYYLGESIKLTVIVSNTGVGHNFPAGTIDLNEAWIYLSVRDSEGRSVYQSGTLDDNNELTPEAHRYHSIPTNRQGKEVWRHDLFNMTGETYRNVIKAGGSDVVNYQFTVPYWTKGPLIVDALLKYRKLNTRYAKWALKDSYLPLPIVTMAKDSLIIEIRHETPVKFTDKYP